MKVNKELKYKYEDFLFEFLKKYRNQHEVKGKEILILFRKIVLLKESCDSEENQLNYIEILKDTELTPEIIYLIEETLFDERFIWTIKKFLDFLILKEIKVSKKVIDKLCKYTLNHQLNQAQMNLFYFYLKKFKINGLNIFLKKVLEDKKLVKGFMFWYIIKVTGELGCVGCYESIKNFLDSKNEKNIYYAKEALKKLDKLKLN